MTCALRFNVVLTSRELGIGAVEVNATPMGAATMVRFALLLCEGLLVTVAMMVMDPPMGAMEGAVYVVTCPSAVCTGDKVPQAPLATLPVTGLPPQVTTQSTPALMLSPVGIMLNFTAEAIASVETFPEAPRESMKLIGPAVACRLEVPPQLIKIMLGTARYSRHSRLTAPLRRRVSPRLMRPSGFVFGHPLRTKFCNTNGRPLILFCS